MEQEKIKDTNGILIKHYNLRSTIAGKPVINGKISMPGLSLDEPREIDFCAFGPVAEYITKLNPGDTFIFSAFEKTETYKTKSGDTKTETKFNVVWLEQSNIELANSEADIVNVSSKGKYFKSSVFSR